MSGGEGLHLQRHERLHHIRNLSPRKRRLSPHGVALELNWVRPTPATCNGTDWCEGSSLRTIIGRPSQAQGEEEPIATMAPPNSDSEERNSWLHFPWQSGADENLKFMLSPALAQCEVNCRPLRLAGYWASTHLALAQHERSTRVKYRRRTRRKSETNTYRTQASAGPSWSTVRGRNSGAPAAVPARASVLAIYGAGFLRPGTPVVLLPEQHDGDHADGQVQNRQVEGTEVPRAH